MPLPIPILHSPFPFQSSRSVIAQELDINTAVVLEVERMGGAFGQVRASWEVTGDHIEGEVTPTSGEVSEEEAQFQQLAIGAILPREAVRPLLHQSSTSGEEWPGNEARCHVDEMKVSHDTMCVPCSSIGGVPGRIIPGHGLTYYYIFASL